MIQALGKLDVSLDGFIVKNRAQSFGLVAHLLHGFAVVFQQRQKQCGITGDGLKIERHFVLRKVRFFQAAYVKLKRVRPAKVAELVSRHAYLWGNLLKEISHRACARLHEVADFVLHIFENVGKLLVADP